MHPTQSPQNVGALARNKAILSICFLIIALGPMVCFCSCSSDSKMAASIDSDSDSESDNGFSKAKIEKAVAASMLRYNRQQLSRLQQSTESKSKEIADTLRAIAALEQDLSRER